MKRKDIQLFFRIGTLSPGSNFVLEMQKASVEMDCTIAVLSQDYLDALYTASEWAAAFASDPTGVSNLLIPVRVKPCELKGLLAQVIYIDLQGLEESNARDKLISGIKKGRRKPLNPPSFPVSREISEKGSPSFPGYRPHKKRRRFAWLGLVTIFLLSAFAIAILGKVDANQTDKHEDPWPKFIMASGELFSVKV